MKPSLRIEPTGLHCPAGWVARGLVLLSIALALGTPALAVAQTASACLLICAKTTSCQLRGDDQKVHALLPAEIRSNPNCGTLTLIDGVVVMKYRHKGQWFAPPETLPKGKSLAAVFSRYAPDACSLPSPPCLQQHMNSKSTSRAGHGADSQAAAPAGSSDPCSAGLPCGMVVPPTEPWQFRLQDAAASGQLQFNIHRGAPPAGVPKEFSVAVQNGMVTAPAAQFSTGAVYAYRWLNSAGKLMASGEFEVMGASRLAQLKSRAADRIERQGLSKEAAWIDALHEYGLDWDAIQTTLLR